MIETTLKNTARRNIVVSASLVVLISSLCIGLAGCGKGASAGNGNSGSPSDSTVGSSSSIKGTDIAATVNDEPITVGQFYDAMEHYVPTSLPNFPNNPQVGWEAGRVVFRNLIINQIKLQLAKDQNVAVTQADLDRWFDDYRLEEQAQSVLPPDAMLQEQGYTEDQFKQEVLAPQIAEINLLQKTVVITPEALQSAYKLSIQKYTISPAVHIHRIACLTKSQAESVVQGIKAGQPISNYLTVNVARDGAGGDPNDDTNFANWINTDHIDPSLGPMGSQLATAKAGDIVGPVQIGQQWLVMQVAEKRPAQVLPFDKVQDIVLINYVRQIAAQNQGNQDLQDSEIRKMRQANIQINLPAYAGLAAQMHDAPMPVPASNPAASAPNSH
jgi:parvulin-like peptidyl-prolyl isomerase